MDKKDYGGMPEIPQYYEKRREKAFKGCMWSMVLAVLLLIVLSAVMLTSCTTTEYVTVEKVRTDTTYITKWQKDSVWLHDSIRVSEQGDTVRIERWHTKYVERLKTDTLYRATHDTIPQPYPIETVKLVEKEMNWWQRLRLWLGNVVLLALIGVGVYYGWKLWKVYKLF